MKGEIRRRMARARMALSPEVVRAQGAAVRSRVLATDLYRNAGCISCYVSVKNEVDTSGLIEAALAAGKRVGAPVSGARGRMVHREVRRPVCLRPARFGLLEPAAGEEIPPGAFDLVVVPGLAFDLRGHRVGFGGGYYDRFLAQTDAPRIGLAYAFQVVDRLPSESHDVGVDLLVTETRVYVCSEKGAMR